MAEITIYFIDKERKPLLIEDAAEIELAAAVLSIIDGDGVIVRAFAPGVWKEVEVSDG